MAVLLAAIRCELSIAPQGDGQMLATAVPPLRLVASIALGQPFPLRALDRMIAAVQDTRRVTGREGGPDDAPDHGGVPGQHQVQRVSEGGGTAATDAHPC
jgi:hypothetical protein